MSASWDESQTLYLLCIKGCQFYIINYKFKLHPAIIMMNSLISNDSYAHHILRSCSRILNTAKNTQKAILKREELSPTATHTARCEGIYAIINFQCSCYAYMWNYVFGRNNIARLSAYHLLRTYQPISAAIVLLLSSPPLCYARKREKKIAGNLCRNYRAAWFEGFKKEWRETHQILIFRFSSTHAVTFSELKSDRKKGVMGKWKIDNFRWEDFNGIVRGISLN